ncbi:MAG: putative toxin-antitoxin system toxin component, PIN family [Chloroflexi bacterium]|nr:putative toxin-antitoxin system toxin component, PIN family [Chloroflexota bacterium]
MYNERRSDLIGAVLDTSVSVSGFLSQRGASAEIIRQWLTFHNFQLIASDPTIIELTDKLLELDIDEAVMFEFVKAIYRTALITDNTYIVNVVTDDPDDNIFLATAMEGQADYLVSLDRHLLSLKYYQGVQIVWPRDFLKMLSASHR